MSPGMWVAAAITSCSAAFLTGYLLSDHPWLLTYLLACAFCHLEGNVFMTMFITTFVVAAACWGVPVGFFITEYLLMCVALTVIVLYHRGCCNNKIMKLRIGSLGGNQFTELLQVLVLTGLMCAGVIVAAELVHVGIMHFATVTLVLVWWAEEIKRS